MNILLEDFNWEPTEDVIRNSPPEMFLLKGVLKICSKCTGEHPSQSLISTKCNNFFKITLRHWCSPVNVLLIFRMPFPKSTSGGLLLL